MISSCPLCLLGMGGNSLRLPCFCLLASLKCGHFANFITRFSPSHTPILVSVGLLSLALIVVPLAVGPFRVAMDTSFCQGNGLFAAGRSRGTKSLVSK